MTLYLTENEEKALEGFLTQLQLQTMESVSKDVAIRFLMARKFNVTRAVELYVKHQTLRKKEGLINIDPQDPLLRRELESGKLTVLKSYGVKGETAALFTARLHFPLRTAHRLTLQSLIYQLDAALADYSAQRNGVVFIYDMNGAKYANFDYELCQKVLTILKGAYPARLKKIVIVQPPFWFHAPFTLLRLFLREKLQRRVFMINCNELSKHLSFHLIPSSLGGSYNHNHWHWLQKCSFSAGRNISDSLLQSSMTLSQFVVHVTKKSRSGLIAEYEELKEKDRVLSLCNPEYAIYNRYRDVPCYNHSRVMLPGNTYIHANYVPGYKNHAGYICTQGPLSHTCHDFWKMVWYHRVNIIVMTTRLTELGQNKSALYWPLSERQCIEFGNFKISNCKVQEYRDYKITSLTLTDKANSNTDTLNIDHFQYTAWPDCGVPSNSMSFLEFLMHVNQNYENVHKFTNENMSPVIVHCSAGIGRTGTFCTLDMSIRLLKEDNAVNIRSIVELIRSRRAHSIQTVEQYLFCHSALLAYVLKENLLSRQQIAMIQESNCVLD